MKRLFLALALGYVGLVVPANWLASKYTITKSLSYLAPATACSASAPYS